MTKTKTADGSGWIVRIGAVGAGLTAICCFTPVLAVGMAAVGVSAGVLWLDAVLVPLLAGFVGLMAFGLWLRNRRADDAIKEISDEGH